MLSSPIPSVRLHLSKEQANGRERGRHPRFVWHSLHAQETGCTEAEKKPHIYFLNKIFRLVAVLLPSLVEIRLHGVGLWPKDLRANFICQLWYVSVCFTSHYKIFAIIIALFEAESYHEIVLEL